MKRLDFDKLAKLAKKDPKLFEEVRLELIEDLIASSSEKNKEKLRKLQWRIDAERKRHKTPLKSCIVLHDMMMESFYEFQNVLNKVTGKAAIEEKKEETKVISIKSLR